MRNFVEQHAAAADGSFRPVLATSKHQSWCSYDPAPPPTRPPSRRADPSA